MQAASCAGLQGSVCEEGGLSTVSLVSSSSKRQDSVCRLFVVVGLEAAEHLDGGLSGLCDWLDSQAIIAPSWAL